MLSTQVAADPRLAVARRVLRRAAESEPAAPDVAPDATVDALGSRLGAALGADEGFRATSRGKVSACVEINVASMA